MVACDINAPVAGCISTKVC